LNKGLDAIDALDIERLQSVISEAEVCWDEEIANAEAMLRPTCVSARNLWKILESCERAYAYSKLIRACFLYDYAETAMGRSTASDNDRLLMYLTKYQTTKEFHHRRAKTLSLIRSVSSLTERLMGPVVKEYDSSIELIEALKIHGQSNHGSLWKNN
jgi:hypothetical protein